MGKSSSNLDWDPLGNLGLPTVVLYGDTGHGLHGLGSQNGNGPPSGGGSGGGSPPVINTAGAGLTINISWDASVANAPTAFTTVVNNVVQYLQSQFSDPVTINIAIGYGEVGGSNLPGGALGASSTYLAGYGYSTIKNALAADAKTTADASAVASLPASDPTGGNWWVTTAEAKAIGLMGASSSIDGNIGFTSAGLFDYDNTDGVGAGLYDFYGVVEHEISEVMGRILLTSGRIGFYFNSNDVYDLFHYSSTGTHTFSASTPGYFSVDNGVTHINTFNTVSGGDAGDWKGDTVDADNAFATPGVKLPVTTGDLTTLDAIGWDAGPAPVLPDLTVSNFALDFSTGKASFQVNNIGTASAGASTAGLYLSSDSTITTSDTLLGNPAASTPPIGAGAAASDSPESILFSLTAPATAGTYYLGVVTDTSNAITESNEGNNASNALPVILGTDLANTLTGTTGNDTMFGFGGNDKLTGGKGADLLTGGAGSDTFAYSATSDSSSLGTSDVITDFAPGDHIDLSAIDANSSSRHNQAFSFGGQTSAVVAHSVTWYDNGANTIIQADVNGNSVADLVIVLSGHHTLAATDFVL